MIYVEMYGRLGNQLFRYAVARALQRKYYPDENICLSFNQIDELHKQDKTFYNCLEDFNVKEYIKYNKKGKVIFNESTISQKLIATPYYMKLRKLGSKDMSAQQIIESDYALRLMKKGLYWFRTSYQKFVRSDCKNKFVSGAFENKNFFDEIRDDLLIEFTPKYDIPEKNKFLYEKIKNTNSVCVSVRRGDFVTDELIKRTHYVCDNEYFYKAIEAAKKKIDDPTFFMFSDDIEWVKENIKIEGSEMFYESGTDPVWEKLRIMYNCKHFILSNSSFSWWAQYLSRNEDKIVISPSKWFNNDYCSGLVEDKFIKI